MRTPCLLLDSSVPTSPSAPGGRPPPRREPAEASRDRVRRSVARLRRGPGRPGHARRTLPAQRVRGRPGRVHVGLLLRLLLAVARLGARPQAPRRPQGVTPPPTAPPARPGTLGKGRAGTTLGLGRTTRGDPTEEHRPCLDPHVTSVPRPGARVSLRRGTCHEGGAGREWSGGRFTDHFRLPLPRRDRVPRATTSPEPRGQRPTRPTLSADKRGVVLLR